MVSEYKPLHLSDLDRLKPTLGALKKSPLNKMHVFKICGTDIYISNHILNGWCHFKARLIGNKVPKHNSTELIAPISIHLSKNEALAISSMLETNNF